MNKQKLMRKKLLHAWTQWSGTQNYAAPSCSAPVSNTSQSYSAAVNDFTTKAYPNLSLNNNNNKLSSMPCPLYPENNVYEATGQANKQQYYCYCFYH